MSAFYAKGAARLLAPLNGGAAPTAGTLKAVMVKNTYVQNLTSDEFYSDISTYACCTPLALASVTVTGGIVDSNDPTFTGVSTGDTAEAIVLYMDTGNPATSWLVAYIDVITGFPVATTGGNVSPQWDNGTYKIISLI